VSSASRAWYNPFFAEKTIVGLHKETGNFANDRKIMHNHLKILILAFTTLLLASCSPPVLRKTISITNTSVETATAQPRQPTPSATLPAPTFTPTKLPVATSLNQTGPFVLFKGLKNGIWITNPDGSFPTRIFSGYSLSELHSVISPKGDRIALVIFANKGLDLVMITLPDGKTETIAHLIDLIPPDYYLQTAIYLPGSFAWQPGDGRYLAFTAQIKGPGTDLYLYDTQTKKITQLTKGRTQIVSPFWSPDGKYILHFDVGGGSAYDKVNGVWAVQVSDGKLIHLPKPEGNNINFVGWRDESHYITYDDSDEKYCDEQKNLHSVDIISGESTPLIDMDSSFYYFMAQSPENGALLLTSIGRCTFSLGQGAFLLLPGETAPKKVFHEPIPGGIPQVGWMPESKVFFISSDMLISSDGRTRYDPPGKLVFHSAISKDGYQAWGVHEMKEGSVEVKAPGGEWQNVLNGNSVLIGNAVQLMWSPSDGQTLLIVLIDGSLYSASAPDFKAQKMGTISSDIDQAAWLP
jgi:hypothetical protein